MGVRIPVIPCTSKDFPKSAIRPINSILENRQLKNEGLNIMPYWQKDLDMFVEKFAQKLLEEARESVGSSGV